jgi:hypothetical protein
MKGLIASFLLVAACSASDDVYLGSRDSCEFGGTLTDCPNADRDIKSACWRLVDCGVIPTKLPDPDQFDWDQCVNTLEREEDARVTIVVACIASATCDELRTRRCLQLGDI